MTHLASSLLKLSHPALVSCLPTHPLLIEGYNVRLFVLVFGTKFFVVIRAEGQEV